MAFLQFLGTAGARFVMMEQLRASGGIWISDGTENIILDPGPGSLVRALSSRPALNPMELTAIILSHKHLDHSNDVNVMIEAMTSGGFKKRGALFAPQDAFQPQPIIFDYLRKFPARVEILSEGTTYSVGRITFTAVKKMRHPVETYGLVFTVAGRKIALVTDTGYSEDIAGYFAGDTLIINVVLAEPKPDRPDICHLSLPEAEKIIAAIRPGQAILTHFGRTVLALDPRTAAAGMSRRLKLPVMAATDGLRIEL